MSDDVVAGMVSAMSGQPWVDGQDLEALDEACVRYGVRAYAYRRCSGRWRLTTDDADVAMWRDGRPPPSGDAAGLVIIDDGRDDGRDDPWWEGWA
jgi:hypothetical protein